MFNFNQTLARSAGPTLLTVGPLLGVGAVLTAAGQTVVGWSIYGVGYVGTVIAFPALAAARRAPLGRSAAVGLALLLTGIVVGLPVMLMVLGFYAENDPLHDLLMPYAMSPVGMVAGPLAWLGLAVFGIAEIRDRALPLGASVLFAVAPVLALPAEIGLLPQQAWAAAFLLVSVALVLVGRTAVRPPATAWAS